MLSARRLSARGGQTEFANTYASFEDLPKSRQEELQKLRVVHSVANFVRLSHRNPTRVEEDA
jgi:alpha-ketoglutarate-dependent taurine dioxygenase